MRIFDVIELCLDFMTSWRRKRSLLWNRNRPTPPVVNLWKYSLKPLIEQYLSGVEADERERTLIDYEKMFFNGDQS